MEEMIREEEQVQKKEASYASKIASEIKTLNLLGN